MKKTAFIIIILIIFTGCTALAYNDNEVNEGRLRVIATAFPLYDFARNIAGDNADIVMLFPPSADKHTYEPTPRDIILIKECDLLFYVGGVSDNWVEKAVAESPAVAVRLADKISLTDNRSCCADNNKAGFDEHIWTSPLNAVEMVLVISEALCRLDERNAELYRENTEAYISRLREIDGIFTEITENAARDTIIVADRFALRYFTDAYGLQYHAAFPNCAEAAEPSALTMAFLINKIKDEQIPVIFYAELSDKRIANAITRETGAEALLFHSCHTVTRQEFNNNTGYIELMRQNAAALRRALS